MASRKELHEQLCTILGSRNVYFQPPESVKLQYPCIIYQNVGIDAKRADNKLYVYTNRYEITCIDRAAESNYPYDILKNFEMCRLDRKFTNDNLYHSVLTLFY